MRERCCSRPARDRVARQPGGRRPRRAHRRESGACGGEREPRQPPACVRLLGLALAAAVVAVGSLLVRSDGETLAVQAANGVPALTSKAQLQRLAASVDHPVYWAGPRPGFSYELTRTTTGRIFVRYLPHGVATGDSRPDFLIVGTYPGDRPFADLKRAANREGVDWVGLDHGGLVVFAARNSRSAYFGYPSRRYQVEVVAPSSDTARKLVLGGAIVPVR